MGVRQILNERPVLSASITGSVIAVALVFIIWQFVSGIRSGSHHKPMKDFYSDDDGKTYFADQGNKLTPFTDANGNQAVEAVVYRCSDGTPFVAYLMRHTAEGRKLVSAPMTPVTAHFSTMSIMEVKKPGAKDWVKFDPKNAKAYTDVMTPSCPDGGKDGLRPVFP